MNLSMLDWALKYAARGIHVFPCHYVKEDGFCSCGIIPKGKTDLCRMGKHPFWGSQGFKDATTDSEQIKRWWADGKEWSIGAATGQISGFWAIDQDNRKGGDDTIRGLWIKHGEFPRSPQAITGSGGMHYYFRMPEHGDIDSRSPWGDKGVDIRGNKGYVILPPSRAGERCYAWELEHHIDDTTFIDAPAWVEDEIKAYLKSKAETSAPRVDGQISAGARRPMLMSLAGTMRRRGMDAGSIRAALLETNKAKCNPVLSEADVEKVVTGVMKYAASELKADVHMTDLGNSLRLVDRHGQEFRYCPELGWLVWDGARWCQDELGSIMELAKDTVRWLMVEAEQIEDADKRKAARKWALQSESRDHLKAMVELAKTVSGIVVRASSLDADIMLLNCPNGTVDLTTGVLREHRQGDLITKVTSVPYDPAAKSQMWDDFLKTIMKNDKWNIYYLKQAIGYSLTGSTREQCFFIPYGNGANGKSTFLETIAHIIGDYACHATIETFLTKRNDGIPNDVAALKGARLVLTGEVPEGRNMKESTIKLLTGGDKLSARKLRHEFFSFLPELKLWMGTNHKPIIKGSDHGIWRRPKIIPFTHTFENPDMEFKSKLIATELHGILAWAIQGCLEWEKDGLVTPEGVDKATLSYKADMDVLGGCIADRFNEGGITASNLAYKIYNEYCQENGEAPVNSRAFKTAMEARGYSYERTSVGRFFTGLSPRGEVPYV